MNRKNEISDGNGLCYGFFLCLAAEKARSGCSQTFLNLKKVSGFCLDAQLPRDIVDMSVNLLPIWTGGAFGSEGRLLEVVNLGRIITHRKK